jgi:Tellurite resistance protein TerB
MELTDLNEDERIALVVLLEVVVAADGEVSRDELTVIKRVIDAIGRGPYQAAVAAADARFDSDDAARAFLLTIERPEARALLYETALEAALAHGVAGAESELLTWLQKQWKVAVSFDRPEST